MNEPMVTITEKEYNQLLEDSMWLSALEDAGVDNWCGYEAAMDTLQEWKNEEE